MRVYCSHCGAASDFTAAKPKFCHKCGKSFGVSTASDPEPQASLQESLEQETIDEEEQIPNIGGLEVDISHETHFKHSFGGLVGTSDGPSDSLPRKKEKRISKKKFLEDFKKEAGSIKKK